MTVDRLNELFVPPTPDEVIDLLVGESKLTMKHKALVLVIDGLHNLSPRGELDDIVTALGDLAQRDSYFLLVCGTSTVSGPVDQALRVSKRRRVFLPCKPIDPPTDNGEPVFKDTTLLAQVLIGDCGGHGRALELLADHMWRIQRDVDAVSFFIEELGELYEFAMPVEADAKAVVKAAMVNRRLSRDEPMPGGSSTPDEISQFGLVYFDLDNESARKPLGTFKVPYIWILSLCAAYPNNTLFQELQLLDYRDFCCIENPTIPGNTSWDSFEKLMVQIRKIRSCTFSEGERATIGDLHHGGFMTNNYYTTARLYLLLIKWKLWRHKCGLC